MKPKILPSDRVLFVVTLALVCFGLVMVFDSSYPHGAAFYNDGWYFAKRHTGAALLGILAMLVLSHIHYARLRTVAFLGYALSLWLLSVVAVSGNAALGGQRWIGWGWFQVQPSELAKPALILFSAVALRKWPMIATSFWPFATFCLVAGIPIVLTERQPDLGTAVTMALGLLGILSVAGTRLRFLAAATAFAAVLIGGMMLLPSRHGGESSDPNPGNFRLKRIEALADPGKARFGAGLQNWHSYVALANGGWAGVGFTNSMEKRVGGVPMQRTDFIFAIVGEEFGLLGTVIVLTLFVMIAVRGYGIACRCRDPFGQYLAVGITTGVVGQAALNIAVVTGLVPVTGVPLPFISYGGSALITGLASIGILLGISRVPFRPERGESTEMEPGKSSSQRRSVDIMERLGVR